MRALPRVYCEEEQFLVSVRYGDWHDLREFITPHDPAVQQVYSQVGPDAWQLLDFVCRNISYRRDISEFWQFSSETIATRQGDCEDSSILLTSLIRVGRAPNAYVALGNLGGYGHAWCQLNGQILETTFTSARVVPNSAQYCPYVLFDNEQVIELWPGALGDIFELRRDEATKLNLMASMMPAEPSSNPGDYRYAGLPEACICESCGYELINPGTHCQAIRCPVCGGVMWRKK